MGYRRFSDEHARVEPDYKAGLLLSPIPETAIFKLPTGLCAPIPHNAPPMPFDATASDFYYHDAQGNWLFAMRRHIDVMDYNH